MSKDIVRFYRTGTRKRLIHSGVTLAQAQEWCSSPYTKKEGVYFDGFADHHMYHTKNVAPKYDHYFEPNAEYN